MHVPPYREVEALGAGGRRDIRRVPAPERSRRQDIGSATKEHGGAIDVPIDVPVEGPVTRAPATFRGSRAASPSRNRSSGQSSGRSSGRACAQERQSAAPRAWPS